MGGNSNLCRTISLPPVREVLHVVLDVEEPVGTELHSLQTADQCEATRYFKLTHYLRRACRANRYWRSSGRLRQTSLRRAVALLLFGAAGQVEARAVGGARLLQASHARLGSSTIERMRPVK